MPVSSILKDAYSFVISKLSPAKVNPKTAPKNEQTAAASSQTPVADTYTPTAHVVVVGASNTDSNVSWYVRVKNNSKEAVAGFRVSLEDLAGGLMALGVDIRDSVVGLLKSLDLIADETQNLAAKAQEIQDKKAAAVASGDPVAIANANREEQEFNQLIEDTAKALEATGDQAAIDFANKLRKAKTPGEVLQLLNDIYAARNDLAAGNYGRLIIIATAQEGKITIELRRDAEEAARNGNVEEASRIAAELEDHQKVMEKIQVMASDKILVPGDQLAVINVQVEKVTIVAGAASERLLALDRTMRFLTENQRSTFANMVLDSIQAQRMAIDRLYAADNTGYERDSAILEWSDRSVRSLELISATIEDAVTAKAVTERLKALRQEVDAIETRAIQRREVEKKEAKKRSETNENIRVRAKSVRHEAEVLSIRVNAARVEILMSNSLSYSKFSLLDADRRAAENKARTSH